MTGGTGGNAGSGGTAGSGNASPTCGNDQVEGTELCDGPDLGGETCSTLLAGSPGGQPVCSQDCKSFDLAQCIPAATCGNGSLDAGEHCDGALLGDESCQTQGFAGGDLTCNPNCSLNVSACNACGNEVVDPGEQCDGPSLGSQTCEGLGKPSGVLVCNADCTLRTLGCGADWAQWPMPNPPQSGLPNPQSYTIDEPADVVVDDVTGLMWQRTFAPSLETWEDAVIYCDSLEHGGFADWRLPTRIELVSITNVVYQQPGPAIDAIAFPGTPGEDFWANAPFLGLPGSAWVANFYWGGTYHRDVTSPAYVRCVR
jgi:hypothetical protein